jgi:endonuclease/exonuclease/phosphatase family metal-dependent hydrolase
VATADDGPADAPAEKTLQVATLNTWGLPYPVAAESPRARFPRIQNYLDRIDADIVGLQEVWRGAKGLLRVPGMHATSHAADTGLAIVSPHPVHDMWERTYDAARGVDRLKRKGLLSAEVDTPSAGTVAVFVTHLQAGPGPKNADVRAAQVGELLDRVATTDLPAIVMGDFNFDPRQDADVAAAEALRTAGFSDAAAAVGRRKATHPGDGQRYDRVYLRGNRRRALTPRMARVDESTEEGLLSDHLPVRVEVAVVSTP